MDRARERDRLPRKLFPVDRGVGIVAAASSAKLGRGSMAMAGKAAPAAPNPLTKLRRLTGPRPFSRLFPPPPCACSRAMGSHSQHADRSHSAHWRTSRPSNGAENVGFRVSPMRTCPHVASILSVLASAPENAPVTQRIEDRGQCQFPLRGRFSRWFARPLILGVAVLLALFAATGFLGLRYWHERQAVRCLARARPPGARYARSAADDHRQPGGRKARVSADPRPSVSQGLRRLGRKRATGGRGASGSGGERSVAESSRRTSGADRFSEAARDRRHRQDGAHIRADRRWR